MSSVNVMAREIAAKVVFYGPGLSGKTTTLKKIYDSVKPAHRGELSPFRPRMNSTAETM